MCTDKIFTKLMLHHSTNIIRNPIFLSASYAQVSNTYRRFELKVPKKSQAVTTAFHEIGLLNIDIILHLMVIRTPEICN